MTEDPIASSTAPGPAPVVTRQVTFDSLQTKVLELLKNPVVLAGGAVIVGLVVARVAGGSKLRGLAVNAATEFLKVKAVSKFVQPSQPAVPAPPPPQTPPPEDTPAAVASQLGKKILAAVGPQLGELAKKKLAQFFPNQH